MSIGADTLILGAYTLIILYESNKFTTAKE